MDAYIINGTLDNKIFAKRYNSCFNLCTKLGFNCQRSEAVYIDTNNEYKQTCSKNKNFNIKFLKHKEGCKFAHYKVYKKIIASGKRSIIFEDDIILANISFDKLKKDIYQFLDDTKNIDVAYIGYQPGPGIYRFSRLNGLQAYVVTPKGASKLIKNIKLCGGQPIDNQIGKLCHKNVLSCKYAKNKEKYKSARGNSRGLIHQQNDGSHEGGENIKDSFNIWIIIIFIIIFMILLGGIIFVIIKNN